MQVRKNHVTLKWLAQLFISSQKSFRERKKHGIDALFVDILPVFILLQLQVFLLLPLTYRERAMSSPVWPKTALQNKKHGLPMKIFSALLMKPISKSQSNFFVQERLCIFNVSMKAYGWQRINLMKRISTHSTLHSTKTATNKKTKPSGHKNSGGLMFIISIHFNFSLFRNICRY